MSPSPLDTLDSGRAWLQATLGRATRDRRSPFRWPVLCTVDGRGRTVVLRQVQVDSLKCRIFTDRRSAKVSALRQCPEAELVFFDPGHMVQLRLRGNVALLTGGSEWRACLDQLNEPALADYTHPLGPGRALTAPGGAPADPISATETFALIDLTPNTLDLLYLGRNGHRRALYHRGDDGWTGAWQVP